MRAVKIGVSQHWHSHSHSSKGGFLPGWTWPSVRTDSSVKHCFFTCWSKVQLFENTHGASLALVTSCRHQAAFWCWKADLTPHRLLETVRPLQSLEGKLLSNSLYCVTDLNKICIDVGGSGFAYLNETNIFYRSLWFDNFAFRVWYGRRVLL